MTDPGWFKRACESIKLLLFDCDGVLTDGRVILGTNGTELKCFSTTDGMGAKLWHDAGLVCGVVTGRKSEAVTKRSQELKFEEVHQGIAAKGKTLDEILARRNLQPEEVAYIGDDINDLSLGMRVGLFFAPADHNKAIRPYVHYILDAEGGKGVIRETVDIILKNKGLFEEVLHKYIESGNDTKRPV